MRRYLSDIANWPTGGLSLLAGYAAILAGWELGHRAILSDFILKNQLDPAARIGLALWLLAGALAGLIAWLVLSALLLRSGPGAGASRVKALAHAGLLLVALPLLPVLALPDIQTDAPVLALTLVLAVALLAASGVRGVLLFRAPLLADVSAAAVDQALPAVLPTSVPPAPRAAGRLDAGLVLVTVLAAGYALFMIIVTVGRHNAFGTHAFDLGIQAQAMFEIVRRGVPLTTLYGTQVINQFGDHFTPIYYLLAPLYAAWPDATTLLVVQSIWLAAGAFPVYLLARRRLGQAGLAVALAVCYLLFPALHAVNHLDFHEIALATPLLLWALYAMEAERFGLFGLFLALASFAKEEVALHRRRDPGCTFCWRSTRSGGDS